MPPNKDAGLDFLNAIGGISEGPQGSSRPQGYDLPDGFPIQPPEGQLWRTVDTTNDPEAIPGNVETDVTVKRGYFTTFRPWSDCQRCKSDLAAALIDLPEMGDLICPHTNLSSWEDIYKQAAKGRYKVISEQEIMQRDGSVVVSVAWFIYSKKKKKKAPDAPGQQEEPPL